LRFHKARYRKQARTIRIKASDGDSGRAVTDEGNYFRCWHCGFICDIRRDDLSKDGRNATVLSRYPPDPVKLNRDVFMDEVGAEWTDTDSTDWYEGPVEPTHRIARGDTTYNYAVGDAVKLGVTGHDIVMMKLLAGGENATIYQLYSVSGGGCPLCHTTRWKK